MKISSFIIFLLLSYSTFGQDATVKSDSIDLVEDLFITDYKKQLNVKLEVGNDLTFFNLNEQDIEYEIRPNLNIRYSLVFSYKFLSIKFGFRPRISDEDETRRGDTDTFRLSIQLLLENWSHDIGYSYDKGFYLNNTGDFISPDPGYKIQFPNLTSYVLSGISVYRFNKKYSVRAVESQTEAQKKSAGSFMPGVVYNFFKFTGTDELIYNGEDIEIRDNYSDYQGFNIAANAGYFHTFVFGNYWYLNFYGSLSYGIDFYTTTLYDIDEEDGRIRRSYNDPFWSASFGGGIGYNGKKIFFGGKYNERITNDKFSSNSINIQAVNSVFNVFVGYRFKAPRTVTAPVDLIEEKVPILKDDNR